MRRATYLFLSGISAAIARAATGDALPRSAASAAVEFANHLCRSWEDGFDASEPDSKVRSFLQNFPKILFCKISLKIAKLRARLLIATAMKDAERWIERSRPRQDDPPADADEEEELRDVEDPKVGLFCKTCKILLKFAKVTAERTRSALFLKELEVALAKNQALMDVLRHLGYTEDGKKLAAATNYDGDSRIASVSVAISTPSPVTQRMLGMMADRLPLDTLGLSVANGFAAGTPVGRVVRDEREKDPESVPAALVDLALLRGAIASLARCARSNVENSAGGEEEREKLQAATASACGVLYHAIGWLTCRLRPQITKRTRDVDPKVNFSRKTFVSFAKFS